MKRLENKMSQDMNPFAGSLHVWPWVNVKNTAPHSRTPSFFLCKLEKKHAWLCWIKRKARIVEQTLEHWFLGPEVPGSSSWPACVGSLGSGTKMINYAPRIAWNFPKGEKKSYFMVRLKQTNGKQKLISIKIIITIEKSLSPLRLKKER